MSNPCQITIAMISAINVDSIELSGQTATSEMIIELEKKITSLKDKISLGQKKLNAADISSLLSKEERSVTITEHAATIGELRKEINSANTDLHGILLQVCR